MYERSCTGGGATSGDAATASRKSLLWLKSGMPLVCCSSCVESHVAPRGGEVGSDVGDGRVDVELALADERECGRAAVRLGDAGHALVVVDAPRLPGGDVGDTRGVEHGRRAALHHDRDTRRPTVGFGELDDRGVERGVRVGGTRRRGRRRSPRTTCRQSPIARSAAARTHETVVVAARAGATDRGHRGTLAGRATGAVLAQPPPRSVVECAGEHGSHQRAARRGRRRPRRVPTRRHRPARVPRSPVRRGARLGLAEPGGGRARRRRRAATARRRAVRRRGRTESVRVQPDRPGHDRPDPAHARHPCAARGVPARAVHRPRGVVPVVQRAVGRLRRRRARHDGAPRRRRVGDRRSEGVDVVRARGRARSVARAAPIPTSRSTRGSPRSSSTCAHRGSRCGRCAR